MLSGVSCAGNSPSSSSSSFPTKYSWKKREGEYSERSFVGVVVTLDSSSPPCGHFGTSGRTVYSQPLLLLHNAEKEAYLPPLIQSVLRRGCPFRKRKRIVAKQNGVPKSALVGEKYIKIKLWTSVRCPQKCEIKLRAFGGRIGKQK